MEDSKSPMERARPWHSWREAEDRDRHGAAHQHPEDGPFELARGPRRLIAAGLEGEEHDEGIHTLMIRDARLPGPPFDPLDLPLGDARVL